MTSIRCLFRPHKWVFVGNVVRDVVRDVWIADVSGSAVSKGVLCNVYGLYQCSRCKELSKGSPGGPLAGCAICGAKNDEPCDAGLHA